ncbi:MAG: TOBE domain-containing protein, partial [Planktotalea sp.]|uniref:TOBE domain-containing protein n=1 Tax=Planktotalea sp. TaxID=2029877 RepID=UPI003C70C2F4
EQVGSPLELYDTPCNLFVAEFIGSPKMNIIKGPIAQAKNADAIGIRPEHLTISAESGEWEGKAGISEHLGSDTFIRVELEGIEDTMTVRAPGKVKFAIGEKVFLTPVPEELHRFDAAGLRIS